MIIWSFCLFIVKRKKKDKRRQRLQQELSIEELLDSPTFKKFSCCTETILDSAEDVNFGSLDPSKPSITWNRNV